MRSTVIAAMTSTAMRMSRRSAPSGFAEMSGAIVTAALFANLGGGVNAGVPTSVSSRASEAQTRDP